MPERVARLVLVVLGLLSGVACAEDRWYQIEVIGFRYLQAPQADAGAPAELPDYGSAEPLSIAEPNAAAESAPVAFQTLARKDQQLEGVFRQLQRGGSYRPLIHAAWRQTGSQQHYVYLTSEPASAAANGARFDGMEGRILVRLGDASRVDLDVAAYADGIPSRLTETRTVKLNELHYFDHPDLGVLLQITVYDPAQMYPAEIVAQPSSAPGMKPAAPPALPPAKPGAKTKAPPLLITPAKPPAGGPAAPAAPAGGTEDSGPGPSD